MSKVCALEKTIEGFPRPVMAICVITPKRLKIIHLKLTLAILILCLRSGEGIKPMEAKIKMVHINS